MRTKEEILDQIKTCNLTLSFFEDKLNEAIEEMDRIEAQSFPDEERLIEVILDISNVFVKARAEEKNLDKLEKEFKKLKGYKKGSFSASIPHDK